MPEALSRSIDTFRADLAFMGEKAKTLRGHLSRPQIGLYPKDVNVCRPNIHEEHDLVSY